jgi:hypothetical protein
VTESGGPADEPTAPNEQLEPYVFSDHDVGPGQALLDAAFAELLTGWDGWPAIESAAKELDPRPAEPLVRVLARTAAWPMHLGALGERLGCELHPGGGVPGMPAISEISGDVVDLWAHLVSVVTSAGAAARLHDLLFTRRHGDVGAHGRQAVARYLDAVDGLDSDLDTSTYLMRAWTLARLMRAADLEDRVLDEVDHRLASLLADGRREHPGVFFPLLRALAEPPAAGTGRDVADVVQVLERMAATESRDHLAAAIAQMRRALAVGEPAALRQIDEDEVEAHLRGAGQAPNPAVRMILLESAAQLATRRGLTDMAKQIAAQMQAIGFEDLGMQVIEVEGRIPIWVPESFVGRFTRSPDWRDGLIYFLVSPVPSGDVGRLRAEAGRNRSILTDLFPATLFRADGLPVVTLRTPAQRDAGDMAQHGKHLAEYQGHMLATGLQRLADRYGAPAVDEVTTLILELGAGDRRLARSLAMAFKHFWDGDFEACVHVAVPKVEAAARGLLRDLDEGIYRVQANKDPGQYVGLYVLLENLEQLALDPSWAWFLRWLLLGPVGQNIRNDVAHGFTSEVGPTYAALVLRAAAVLILASPIVTDMDKRLELVSPPRRPSWPVRFLDANFSRILNAVEKADRLRPRGTGARGSTGDGAADLGRSSDG